MNQSLLKNSISDFGFPDFQMKISFTKCLIWSMILFINFHEIVTDDATTENDGKKEFCKNKKLDQVVDVSLPLSRVTYFVSNNKYWPVVNGNDYKRSLTSTEAFKGTSK